MNDYPRTSEEFERRFSTDDDCRAYLVQLRWPDGFQCPKCGGATAWPVRTVLLECAACGRQTSVTAGTIFQDTRTPLSTWFRAMWWVASQKAAASATDIQQVLGLGSYETAWTWLHKLRRAMVRPGRDLLTGRIEVDATYLDRVEARGRGRRTSETALIAVAVEAGARRPGRIRARAIKDASPRSVRAFVDDTVAPGSAVRIGGLLSSGGLRTPGARRGRTLQRTKVPAGLPRVHRVVSLLRRWLLHNHQGAAPRARLDYYLDEFTFRFNCRAANRGKLFYHLAQQAVAVNPAPYTSLVKQVQPRPPERRRHQN
jgi:Transposase zinc-ribbon domain/ISXO2-like transposase domain